LDSSSTEPAENTIKDWVRVAVWLSPSHCPSASDEEVDQQGSALVPASRRLFFGIHQAVSGAEPSVLASILMATRSQQLKFT
jgi:hypothetical protein